MRFAATNCCLSHLRCSKVAITTIAMVMSSVHESSATPVYEHRGKTNLSVAFSVDATHALTHTFTRIMARTHKPTWRLGKHALRKEKSSDIRSLVGSVGGHSLRNRNLLTDTD